MTFSEVSKMKFPAFYRELNGDYLLVVCENSNSRGDRWLDGLATAIGGNTSQICWTEVDRGYLSTCKRVSPSKVPAKWKNKLLGTLQYFEAIER